MERARAGRVVEPSEEVQTRDLQRLAEPADRPDVAVFGEKTNLTSPPARKAAAFFRMSRSAWSRVTSFFKAEILARSAQLPVPGKGSCWGCGQVPYPAPQHALGYIEVAGGLRPRHTSIRHQPCSLDLELTAELPCRGHGDAVDHRR